MEHRHGTCGTCAWELYQGTLVIAPENGKEGILAEPDDLPMNEWPWREYAGTIKEVLIADGVRAGRSAAGLFRYMEMCSGFEIEQLDVSGTEDMSCMFDGCSGLEDLSPVSGWNTANVRYMCGMFEDCDALCSTSPLKGWDTGKVEDMSDMFCMCSSLKDLSGLAGWDTGNVTDMSYMFAKCFSLSDISPLAGWDTKNVAQTDYMFYVCSALDDISLDSVYLHAMVGEGGEIVVFVSYLMQLSCPDSRTFAHPRVFVKLGDNKWTFPQLQVATAPNHSACACHVIHVGGFVGKNGWVAHSD